MENSGIEWTHHTFNPWWGCTKVSAACDNCYAETWNQRFHGGVNWGAKAERRRTKESYWRQPLKWNKEAAERGQRVRVFCASLADVFDNQVPEEWRRDLWELIRATPNLDWLLLTKRPQNIKKMLPADWGRGWPNVWLGTSVENQKAANLNIAYLLSVPAFVHFLSCEPLLGPIDFFWTRDPADLGEGGGWIDGLNGRSHDGNGDSCGVKGIDWVIVGGESGPQARVMSLQWARSVRDQCLAAGVPFLFKQWGEWAPAGGGHKSGEPGKFTLVPQNIDLESPSAVFDFYPRQFDSFGSIVMELKGKKKAGRALDGRLWDEYPKRGIDSAN